MKNRLLWCVAAMAIAVAASAGAKEPTMVDVAQRLYERATPNSFDGRCAGAGAKLEVTGDRHSCSKPKGTTVVRFAGEERPEATVFKKGIHKEVISQLRRKYGPPSSVKTLGAMKMYFWFTKDTSVSVGIQSSPESRSTMVTFRPRS